MSISVSTDIFCDHCDEWTFGVAGQIDAEPRLARNNAQINGWKRHYNHKLKKWEDYCPKCELKYKNERPPRD